MSEEASIIITSKYYHKKIASTLFELSHTKRSKKSYHLFEKYCSHLHRKWQWFCDKLFGASIRNERLVSLTKPIFNVNFINRVRYPIHKFEREIESVVWIVRIGCNNFILRCVILVLLIQLFLFRKIHLSRFLLYHLFHIRHKR